MQSCGCIPSMINYNLCVRDAKLQSCGCIPSMINYNLFVRERVRKKERTKYNLIKTKNLRKEGRKEELQLDQCVDIRNTS